jgi:hypothetical protein
MGPEHPGRAARHAVAAFRSRHAASLGRRSWPASKNARLEQRTDPRAAALAPVDEHPCASRPASFQAPQRQLGLDPVLPNYLHAWTCALDPTGARLGGGGDPVQDYSGRRVACTRLPTLPEEATEDIGIGPLACCSWSADSSCKGAAPRVACDRGRAAAAYARCDHAGVWWAAGVATAPSRVFLWPPRERRQMRLGAPDGAAGDACAAGVSPTRRAAASTRARRALQTTVLVRRAGAAGDRLRAGARP